MIDLGYNLISSIYYEYTIEFKNCIWCLPGWWAVVSGYKFLTIRCFRKKQLKQPPLKMPATDAAETSGICNLRL